MNKIRDKLNKRQKAKDAKAIISQIMRQFKDESIALDAEKLKKQLVKESEIFK